MKARDLFRKNIRIIDGRTWDCNYKTRLKYSSHPKWLVWGSVTEDVFKIVPIKG